MPFTDILQIFIQTGLNDLHIFISVWSHYGQELDKQLVGRLCATKAVDDPIWLT